MCKPSIATFIDKANAIMRMLEMTSELIYASENDTIYLVCYVNIDKTKYVIAGTWDHEFVMPGIRKIASEVEEDDELLVDDIFVGLRRIAMS